MALQKGVPGAHDALHINGHCYHIMIDIKMFSRDVSILRSVVARPLSSLPNSQDVLRHRTNLSISSTSLHSATYTYSNRNNALSDSRMHRNLNRCSGACLQPWRTATSSRSRSRAWREYFIAVSHCPGCRDFARRHCCLTSKGGGRLGRWTRLLPAGSCSSLVKRKLSRHLRLRASFCSD